MDIIEPGLAIDLVVNTHLIGEVNDIRTSTIYDIHGKKLIIAQTDPGLLISQLNQNIIISFLTYEKGNPVRYGFQVKIVNFIREYRVASSQTSPAVVVTQKTVPELYNRRMFYRIQPSNQYGLQISLFDQPVNIMDISLGGAIVNTTLSQPHEFNLETGKIIKVTLMIDDRNFNLEAQIKRKLFQEDKAWGRELECIALQFCNRTLELDRVLEGKLLDIQRKLRSKILES